MHAADHQQVSWSDSRARRARLAGQANLGTRFVLVGSSVFFIYDDATVLIKQSFMLDNVELDLVVNARTRIRELAHWRAPLKPDGPAGGEHQQSAEPELLERRRR